MDVCDELQNRRFPGFSTQLIHGKLKKEERQKIMSDFKDGKVHILVATTVIEVGIDVPNATIMIIEHAERFGLAQLHQLRGRVGRGGHASQCFLIAYQPLTNDGEARLDAIEARLDSLASGEIITEPPPKSQTHLCKVPECDEAYRSKGFCARHYQQWRRGRLEAFPYPG